MTRAKFLAAALALMLETNIATAAAPGSAESWAKDCARDARYCSAILVGFISGYLERQELDVALTPAGRPQMRLFCPPNGISPDQLRAVVLVFVANNPKRLHEHIRSVIHSAILEAFPCQ